MTSTPKNSADSLPHRALQMSRETLRSVDECLFILACRDAEERRRNGIIDTPVQGKLWQPKKVTSK
jgi:hypothetical protein